MCDRIHFHKYPKISGLQNERRNMFEVNFWKSAVERAVKTFAQTALALFGAGALDVLTADWQQVLGVSAGAAVLSVLTSVASASVSGGSPSLVKEDQ